MDSRSGCRRTGATSMLSPKVWFAVVLVLTTTVGSTKASRQLLQQDGVNGKRLQAYFDPGCSDARHAPPVKSFLVSDGSWVDCVPIEGQIAAHHPSLKDHVIRMGSPRRQRPSESHPQAFAREHGGCPEGTIPVLRNDPSGNFMKKRAPPFFRKAPSPKSDVGVEAADPATPVETHEYAITGVPKALSSYSGTHSILSVNGPTLGSYNEMTLSQFWIVDGSYDDDSLSTIEVGWQTQPVLHPNNSPYAPHLFIFWTKDAYDGSNGGTCYNLKCPGFVQTTNSWVLGGVMPYYTTLSQNANFEYAVSIEVLYKPSDGFWYLYLDNEEVGYWPKSIYVNGYLQGTANQVQWGGEVAFYVLPGQTVHSKTAMGSGAFPVENWPRAAYHRNITYADASGVTVDPGSLTLDLYRTFDNPLCYDILVQLSGYTNWGTYFFYGGPGGGNPACVY